MDSEIRYNEQLRERESGGSYGRGGICLRRTRSGSIRKNRKKKQRRYVLRTIQSGLVLSTLVFYASQQIGTTYGEFVTSKEDFTGLESCRIFPQNIENLLADLNNRLERASSYGETLLQTTVTDATYDAQTEFPAAETVTDSTYGTARAIFAHSDDSVTSSTYGGGSEATATSSTYDASEQIEALSNRLQHLQWINTNVQQIWNLISEELSAAREIASELAQWLGTSHPNCVEIGQVALLDQLVLFADEPNLLSDSMKTFIRDTYIYLRQIFDTGAELNRALLMTGNQIGQVDAFGGGSGVDGDPASTELWAYYRELERRLGTSIDALTSTISYLSR